MQIRAEKVTLRHGETVIASNLSAQILEGRVTAIVGPSGSGKTTFLSALAGYLTPSEGSIMIQRTAEDAWTAPRPRDFAWVAQGSNALGGRSVIDNALLGSLSAGLSLDCAARAARDELARVGLMGLQNRLARTLSGGELQRLAIARALASRTLAVFADEPTANLDADNTTKIASILHELSHTATVVVATHDPTIISSADVVVEMRPATDAS